VRMFSSQGRNSPKRLLFNFCDVLKFILNRGYESCNIGVGAPEALGYMCKDCSKHHLKGVEISLRAVTAQVRAEVRAGTGAGAGARAGAGATFLRCLGALEGEAGRELTSLGMSKPVTVDKMYSASLQSWAKETPGEASSYPPEHLFVDVRGVYSEALHAQFCAFLSAELSREQDHILGRQGSGVSVGAPVAPSWVEQLRGVPHSQIRLGVGLGTNQEITVQGETYSVVGCVGTKAFSSDCVVWFQARGGWYFFNPKSSSSTSVLGCAARATNLSARDGDRLSMWGRYSIGYVMLRHTQAADAGECRKESGEED
jgi:hypothetical protein